MALPVAPLGQLPNMNMPYSRPFYETTSLTDKALASFLAGLAGNVGGQIAQNTMSRDFAEQPAGFWSKLVQGPQMNRAQFEAQQGRTAAEQQLMKELGSREALAAADRTSREGMNARQIEDSENARAVQMAMQQLGFNQQTAQSEYAARRERDMAGFMNDARLSQIGYNANLDDRNTQREIGYKSTADEQRLLRMIQMMKEAGQGGQGGQPTPTGPQLTDIQRRAMMETSGVSRAEQPSMGGQLLQFLTNPYGFGEAFSQPGAAPVPAPTAAPAQVPTVNPTIAAAPTTPVTPQLDQARSRGAELSAGAIQNRQAFIDAAIAAGMTAEEIISTLSSGVMDYISGGVNRAQQIGQSYRQ